MATLRQLRTFVAVAEHRKMSEAAKHLYVSQPTISQIVSDLEKEYGTALFERQAKELQITPAGELLLENAKKIIAIHETLEQSMKTLSSKRQLRIGATMTVGANIMGKIVQNFEKLHPDIETYVTVHNTEHIEKMLLHNELDIAVVEGVIEHEEILVQPAFDDNLCIICGKEHPFSGRELITAEELHNEGFILREKRSGTRALFEHLMRIHHVPYKVKWECNSVAAITDAVSRNIGLGFVSTRSIPRRISGGSLYVCPIPNMNMKRFFYLCQLKYRMVTSQMQDFINYINSLPTDFQ